MCRRLRLKTFPAEPLSSLLSAEDMSVAPTLVDATLEERIDEDEVAILAEKRRRREVNLAEFMRQRHQRTRAEELQERFRAASAEKMDRIMCEIDKLLDEWD